MLRVIDYGNLAIKLQMASEVAIYNCNLIYELRSEIGPFLLLYKYAALAYNIQGY